MSLSSLIFTENVERFRALMKTLLFNYSMFIFLQETQISFDLYAAVICVALKQNKHASELPLLGKNIPKDHDGIFPPVLPTSISVPPIDINLALFPSGNCVIFSIFLDNRLLFYTLISSNASSIPSGVINVTCRLRSLKSIVILLLITLHISPYKFVYDEG